MRKLPKEYLTSSIVTNWFQTFGKPCGRPLQLTKSTRRFTTIINLYIIYNHNIWHLLHTRHKTTNDETNILIIAKYTHSSVLGYSSFLNIIWTAIFRNHKSFITQWWIPDFTQQLILDISNTGQNFLSLECIHTIEYWIWWPHSFCCVKIWKIYLNE